MNIIRFFFWVQFYCENAVYEEYYILFQTRKFFICSIHLYKSQGFLAAIFVSASDESMSRSKIFPMLIKTCCV